MPHVTGPRVLTPTITVLNKSHLLHLKNNRISANNYVKLDTGNTIEVYKIKS